MLKIFKYVDKSSYLLFIPEELDSDPVIQCIVHDDIKTLKSLIDSGVHMNKAIFDISLIEHCCIYGALECFRFLRSNNIEITKDCLDYSVIGNNKSIITECLSSIEPDENTMEICIQFRQFELMTFLNQEHQLEIPLHLVCEYLNLPALYFLMSDNSNIDKILLESVKLGIPELIEDVLALGANIEVKDELSGNTPLHDAAYFNRPKVAEKLIEHGAEIQSKNKCNMTPLDIAMFQDNSETIATLIYHGAYTFQKNVNIRKQLHILNFRYHFDTDAVFNIYWEKISAKQPKK